ncbi:hypothetical protein LRR18_02755 [Mangrovimonas sp. AS39]|uniref:hypothetical protein n=1 Tax=Mangrovimonas TaxID=1211036 RepID=UPI0006B66E13|nr:MULTISPECIES: hypothetical protein [Mangrovimonas]MCF1190489.1 hypothetical protein [Mangrovimonas futianensis]MCF1193759.1 hypothetical protein [Mangrovimonas futianensis]MCF1420726.1 hypothetical protein [Mangrovimonas futianensis]NIK91036.1 hypothetical protein [Mangrovimonas sp. CR14]
MRKDIEIPKVEGVFCAAVNEFNQVHRTQDWNVYLINDKDVPLEMVLIVSRGYSADKETSLMRHKLEQLPAKSYAKVEFLHEDVLTLNNEFKVTFFEGNTMFEKTFLFRPNTINLKALQPIPLMQEKGVVVK